MPPGSNCLGLGGYSGACGGRAVRWYILFEISQMQDIPVQVVYRKSMSCNYVLKVESGKPEGHQRSSQLFVLYLPVLKALRGNAVRQAGALKPGPCGGVTGRT